MGNKGIIVECQNLMEKSKKLAIKIVEELDHQQQKLHKVVTDLDEIDRLLKDNVKHLGKIEFQKDLPIPLTCCCENEENTWKEK